MLGFECCPQGIGLVGGFKANGDFNANGSVSSGVSQFGEVLNGRNLRRRDSLCRDFGYCFRG